MNIEVGQTYEVTIDDCCVEGKFVAKVVLLNNNSSLTSIIKNYDSTVTFDNGVSFDLMSGVSLKYIEQNPS